MEGILKATSNFDELDAINANSAIGLADLIGQTIECNKLAVMERIDRETSDIKTVAILVGIDGVYYNTISPTAINSVELGVDLMEKTGGSLKFNIIGKLNKSETRTYVMLTISR